MTVEEKENLINERCRTFIVTTIKEDLDKYFEFPNDWSKIEFVSIEFWIEINGEGRIVFKKPPTAKFRYLWNGISTKCRLEWFKFDIEFDSDCEIIPQSVNILKTYITKD